MSADMPDPADTLLVRAFERVLAWPCPSCGQAYPCRCDQADAAQPTHPPQHPLHNSKDPQRAA